jgi:RNA polymerase-binding transcription factor DksA
MNTDHFRKKLEVELDTLETELKTVGVLGADGSWSAKESDLNLDSADINVLASAEENFENNSAILGTLEKRYRQVKAALERISENKYGLCKVCGEPIEAKRLEANPAAETCEKDMR